MSDVDLFVATILGMLVGGGALTVVGRRKGIPFVLWAGVAILTAVGAFIAFEAFFLGSCWAGAGCI